MIVKSWTINLLKFMLQYEMNFRILHLLSVSATVSKGALWGVGKMVDEESVASGDLDACLPLTLVILVAEAHPTVHLV